MDSQIFCEIRENIGKNLSSMENLSKIGNDVINQLGADANHIKELITRTLTLGESNSALIISPQGGGKSLVLKSILHQLRCNGTLDHGIVIKLPGLLLTTDRLALQEITRQLNLDSECAFKFPSFAENLSYLLKTLKSGSKESSKPLVFILDDFDLFCHHHNQTLLYNLFDVCQSAQAPICVLGLTCRLDVIELLEKRVKSRFSHRQIIIFPSDNFECYVKTAIKHLEVSPTNSASKKPVKEWNKHIKNIMGNTDVQKILKQRFFVNRSIRHLKLFLIILMASVSSEDPWLTLDKFRNTANTLWQDGKLASLEGLSILQLSLLICMKHLLKNYDGEPFNFEMVYRQYKKFTDRYSSVSCFEKPVVFKAFDQLQCLELIKPIDNRSSVSREYCLYKLLIFPQQIDETLSQQTNIPTYLSHWCSSDL